MSDNLAACIYVHMLGLLKKKKNSACQLEIVSNHSWVEK